MLNVLKKGLEKTRNFLASNLNKFFGKKISTQLLEDLEAMLLQADFGVATTEYVIEQLKHKSISTSDPNNNNPEIYKNLHAILLDILQPIEIPLRLSEQVKPNMILFLGVNGTGKTTTIAKLANFYRNSGKKVVLACGDTFRAAAIEQLDAWGTRMQIPVFKKSIGSDPAAVIFDAYKFAVENNQDILIADTAGRLHNKKNLMDELKKINKVVKKIDASAPHETMLVLDASIGQNNLTQVKAFNDAVGISGITITKLDGTAKAGIVFAIAKTLNIPIRYIGFGEKITDLKVFNANEFVEALFT